MSELMIELDDELWQEVKRVASESGISPAQLIEQALAHYANLVDDINKTANDKTPDPVTDG